MALFTNVGSSASDLGVTNTFRLDISEYLLASLMPENNGLGWAEIGAEAVDLQPRWEEDKLNNTVVTDTTAGGQTAVSTTLNVSTADAAVLDVGQILGDDASAGTFLGEQVQITAVGTGSPVPITISRGFGGTTATTHAQNATWRIVGRPLQANSDLGRDISRARVPKFTVLQTQDVNVNIAMEQLVRAAAGAAPGVPDELEYQFEQGIKWMTRIMNVTFWASRVSNVTTPNVGNYATTAGVTSYLDGTFNTTATPQTNQGALSDTVINNANKVLVRNGAVPDVLALGTNMVEAISKLYNDRIRIEQSDVTRGFKVKFFDTTMHNSLRILWDNAIPDTAPNGLGYLLDTGRIRIRPYKDGLFYLITAPTFRDGDAVRALSKWGVEMRNTGTDTGAAHLLLSGLS